MYVGGVVCGFDGAIVGDCVSFGGSFREGGSSEGGSLSVGVSEAGGSFRVVVSAGGGSFGADFSSLHCGGGSFSVAEGSLGGFIMLLSLDNFGEEAADVAAIVI